MSDMRASSTRTLSPHSAHFHSPSSSQLEISAAYSGTLANGRRDGTGGLAAPRTVGHMHRVLKQALGQAVRWELLTRNPADAVDPPKVDWKPVQTYDVPQTAN